MNLEEKSVSYIDTKAKVLRWKFSTVKTYKDLLKQYILPALGVMEVADIKNSHVEKLIAKLIDADLSTRRINLVIGLLNQILHDAYVNDEISREIKYNFVQNGKDDEDEESAVKSDPFNPEELDLILDAAPDRYHALFAFLAFTGCRPNEAFALRWSDIDSDHNRITISRGRVFDVESKTKTRKRRDVPMLPRLKAILEVHQTFMNPQDSDYVFQDQFGNPVKTKKLHEVWVRTLNRAGVRYRHMYNLRHSFATNALSGGVELLTVSQVLGHSNIQTTIKHYVKQKKLGKREFDAFVGAFQ